MSHCLSFRRCRCGVCRAARRTRERPRLGDGIFECPPWMQILVRDTEDALTYVSEGKTGGINVIDLANINSCSFIATQDLGKKYPNHSFEVLGRFDNSDIRGCNLMIV